MQCEFDCATLRTRCTSHDNYSLGSTLSLCRLVYTGFSTQHAPSLIVLIDRKFTQEIALAFLRRTRTFYNYTTARLHTGCSNKVIGMIIYVPVLKDFIISMSTFLLSTK